MYITILGSCRQDILQEKYKTSIIKNQISYPHYTKEILQLVNFCLFNDIPNQNTNQIFRTPILNNKPIIWNQNIKNEFDKTDVFVIEIASRKTYKLNNYFVHHILYDNFPYNKNTKNLIELGESTDLEIEEDIIKLKDLLKKPIIIVSHLVTRNFGSRFELKELLKNICSKHNIIFIDPIQELKDNFENIDSFFNKENILAHYSNQGNEAIGYIYQKFLNNI